MRYDAIVVGGGIAGLTSAAFIARAGKSVLVCEKEDVCGGLVNSFNRDGFVFDGGIRATENSGVLFAMVRKLGLDVQFVPNKITMGVEDQVIRIDSKADVETYQALLKNLYPQSALEIDALFIEIKKIMQYMEVQYGIENPAFLDVKEDRDYFIKEIFPWMFKYALTVPKISKMQVPVVEFLRRYTSNQQLIDLISQHFFQQTPAFFALSYINLYLDYHYPMGGTGRITQRMAEFIKDHGGNILTGCKIISVDPENRSVVDSNGESHSFTSLIWAADQKALYHAVDPNHLVDPKIHAAFLDRQALIADKVGNDSVYTLNLEVNLDPGYFSQIASEHFFYTPSRIGQSSAGPMPRGADRETIIKWLEKFLAATTYEISCPVLRDKSLAPAGKTGLIISVLFDYTLTRQIQDQGWYEEFKEMCETQIIKTLDSTIYPGLKKKILQQFSATPLTLANYAGNTDGAIVGWAFTNNPVPAESRIPKILNAIKTPIPHIYQAGQWTYSPAGLPISLITGKLAADQVIKEAGKK